jgi:hypothetical protein
MSIILSTAGGKPVRVDRSVIENEAYLQQYIYDHPEVLPFDQIEPDARPLVLIREFPTSSGPIDALATDSAGNLYVIETKLYKNPDKRLVLAQALDYGAALWNGYDDPDAFISRLDLLMTERGSMGLNAKLRDAYAMEAGALTELVDAMKESVATGQFRFVVLMDRIEDRLKDLISYVNTNSRLRVVGVGLDFYEHGDTRILIPSLYGAEVGKTAAGTGSARRKWDAESFLADATARLTAEDLAGVRELHAWALRSADVVSYGTGQKGSFTPKYAALGARGPMSVYGDATVQLKLNPGWFSDGEYGVALHDVLVRELSGGGFVADGRHEADVYLKPTQWRGKVGALTEAVTRAVASATGSRPR